MHQGFTVISKDFMALHSLFSESSCDLAHRRVCGTSELKTGTETVNITVQATTYDSFIDS